MNEFFIKLVGIIAPFVDLMFKIIVIYFLWKISNQTKHK